MGIVIMILGESGTGKSTSLRNLDPENTLLIQPIAKPLPFKPKGWSVITKDGGNIYHNDSPSKICAAIERTKKDIIVIDDFQYVMANEFMRRVTAQETGRSSFDKYNEIAQGAWSILNTASNVENKRIYIMSHTQTDELGKTKVKTIGKLLDEKIVLEGMVSIVLRTEVINNQYFFRTQNNGNDTTKSPIGIFDDIVIDSDLRIENDLLKVDQSIKLYYEI